MGFLKIDLDFGWLVDDSYSAPPHLQMKQPAISFADLKIHPMEQPHHETAEIHDNQPDMNFCPTPPAAEATGN